MRIEVIISELNPLIGERKTIERVTYETLDPNWHLKEWIRRDEEASGNQ